MVVNSVVVVLNAICPSVLLNRFVISLFTGLCRLR